MMFAREIEPEFGVRASAPSINVSNTSSYYPAVVVGFTSAHRAPLLPGNIVPKLAVLILILGPLIYPFMACDSPHDPASKNNDVDGPIVITNGFLIDGTGSEPIADAAIHIRDGHIQCVGTSWCADIPAGDRL
jgi:hypothetical protein